MSHVLGGCPGVQGVRSIQEGGEVARAVLDASGGTGEMLFTPLTSEDYYGGLLAVYGLYEKVEQAISIGVPLLRR